MEELMNNEEVMDVMEEAGKSKSIIGVAGVSVVAGALLYKFAITPIVNKIKAKKAEKKTELTAEPEEGSED